ncbi:2175_t:CDS:2 [Funneliformis geosporum]|uniref:14258_t:CDS:1 n=1 Tax=Funneliformis geosporum TaxID=1117311 RepID=A0A9W4S9X3_9GLOM|nr:14258_t:CDS:2 [Funneliformis geosporum]CAI2162569.1 2175_t:CDS:2 [Funneliformis geosporum]
MSSLPPEILQEIFYNLDAGHNGLRTLFSCLLVNRYWCLNIVEILWSKPFYYSNAFAKNPNFFRIIDVFLACLDEEDREDLRNNGVNLPVIFDKPLFSYGSYHKHLYYRTFFSSIYLWVQEKKTSYDDHAFEIVMKALLKLFSKCKKVKRTLYIIEGTKGLVTPMFYVQPEHEYLISNVNRIWVDLHIYKPRFFNLLAKNYMGRYNESGSVDIAKFINEQEALQMFQSIYLTPTHIFINALKTQAKTLRCVDFIGANFFYCAPLDGLASCTNLEILRFIKCYNLTKEIVAPLFTAFFPKLTYVTVIKTDCNELQDWAEKFCLEQVNYQDTRNHFDLSHIRELMLNDRTCHVCGEPCIYPLTTNCGHTFCKECILHCLSIYGRCPLRQCRTEISNTKYFYEHPCEPSDPIISETRRLEADRRLLQEMPIYVGHLVFPKMSYTFKVTEQKYRLLVRSCLESRYCKKFGMVFSRLSEYGTLLEIKQIDSNNDGDLILQATATNRFKILSRMRANDNGYEVAEIQIIEDGPDEEERLISRNRSSSAAHEPTTSQLINIARDFINGNELVSLVLHLRDLSSSLDIPENAADFSFHVASLLPIREEEKYELLEKLSVKERMQLIVMWINDLRSQWGTLIIKYMRDAMDFYELYTWIVAFIRYIWFRFFHP